MSNILHLIYTHPRRAPPPETYKTGPLKCGLSQSTPFRTALVATLAPALAHVSRPGDNNPFVDVVLPPCFVSTLGLFNVLAGARNTTAQYKRENKTRQI